MNDPLIHALTTSLAVLEEIGIEHAVTGSFAAAHHGHVRATEDIDIQVALDDGSGLTRFADRMPDEARRVDEMTWAFSTGVLVELYPVRDALDQAAIGGREPGSLDANGERTIPVVPLEALLVLKVREHVRHGHGLKHIADVQALLARNADRLDVEELERLLALDPAWGEAWDEFVEPG